MSVRLRWFRTFTSFLHGCVFEIVFAMVASRFFRVLPNKARLFQREGYAILCIFSDFFKHFCLQKNQEKTFQL